MTTEAKPKGLYQRLRSAIIDHFTIGLDRNTFERAGIASVLVPRLLEKLNVTSSLNIIGSDCPNAEGDLEDCPPDQYPRRWIDGLGKLVNSAKHTSYILIEPSDKAWQNLKQAEEKSGGRLEVLRIADVDSIPDAKVRKLAAECRASHFTFAEEPRQLWIESYHPKGEKEAQYCQYVPPDEADTDPRFDRFKERFAQLKSVATSV